MKTFTIFAVFCLVASCLLYRARRIRIPETVLAALLVPAGIVLLVWLVRLFSILVALPVLACIVGLLAKLVFEGWKKR